MTKCEARFCEIEKDVTFIIVKTTRKKEIKEYYCPEHLRLRAYQLELLKQSNKIYYELKGWKY